MKTICNEIKDKLAQGGPKALEQDEASRRHVADCAECFERLELISELDSALRRLPVRDVSDEVVQALLAKVESVRPAEQPASAARLRRPMTAAPWIGIGIGIAASLVLLASVFLPTQPGMLMLKPASNLRGERAQQPQTRDQEKSPPLDDIIALGSTGAAPAEPPLPSSEVAGKERGEVDETRARDFRLDGDLQSKAASSQEDATVTGESPFLEIYDGKKNAALEQGEYLGGRFKRQLAFAMTAPDFLRERASVEGLSFQEPTGYWANTYVPGDPLMRLLHARLMQQDRSLLEAYAVKPVRLHDRARRTAQTFEPPEQTALGVTLQSDRTGLTGPTRALVEVGLQATLRHGARRPAMNVAVVLDARGDVSSEVAARMRALVLALSEAKELGDRFSLIVAGRAGRAGGVLLGRESFERGPLTVALDDLFGGAQTRKGNALGIDDAVAAAFRQVVAAEDPNAALGTNLVLLVTGQELGSAARTLLDFAHQGALVGAPLSVVTAGPHAVTSEIDALTRAGQGNRRVLETAADAPRVVDQELAAVSRVVARAVRLRIRLAPGVKLVDVPGSRRLDEADAERVREAERAADLKLAKRFGIEADRGDDEEGIQIVIPVFYAGDFHSILLDVVAPGPGPVAEVTVRYKDLAFFKNGVARAALALGREEDSPGPLQKNVVASLVALRLSQCLDEAGRSVNAGDVAGALELLRGFRGLMAGLAPQVSGLESDVAMLDEYVSLLQTSAAGEPRLLAHLSDSLRYAGRLKVLPAHFVN